MLRSTGTTHTYELFEPRRGRVVERPLGPPNARQVLLRVLVNGVCASELQDWLTSGSSDLPLPLGHEPVGEIVVAGRDTSFQPGQLVTGRIDASFSEFVVSDCDELVLVPDGLDPLGVLGEPVGCVLEGLRRTPIRQGARVAMIGAGFMGLVMAQLLTRTLAREVVVIDPREDARAAALDNGADSAVRPVDVEGRDDAESFDVVIEASGAAPALDLATSLVTAHGVLSMLGYHQTSRTIDMRVWNEKALDVVNAHVRDRRLMRDAIQAAIHLQASGRIDPARLITHRFSLDEVDAAYEALATKPTGFIKAVIDIGS